MVAMYGPAQVQHTLPSGQQVTLNMATDYPFSESVVIDVSTAGSVTIGLRIPSWAPGATVQVGNGAPLPTTPGKGRAAVHSPSHALVFVCDV